MAGIPKRAKAVEDSLRGLSLTDTPRWQAAADAVKNDFTPLTDLRASAGYRVAWPAILSSRRSPRLPASRPVTRISGRRMPAHAAE